MTKSVAEAMPGNTFGPLGNATTTLTPGARCRCTLSERLAFEEKCRKYGYSSFSEFQREALKSSTIVIRENKVDLQAVNQLLAIGRNLHQLLKHINFQNSYDQKRLHEVLNTVEDSVLEIMDDSKN